VGSPVNSKAKQTAKNLVLVLCFSPPEAWVCDFLFLLLSFAKAYAFPDFALLKPYVLNSFACHPAILCSGETLCFAAKHDERWPSVLFFSPAEESQHEQSSRYSHMVRQATQFW